MSMVERVARALYPTIASAADFNDQGFESFDQAEPDDPWKERAYTAARAAIEALMEPTVEMVEAGQATECAHGDQICGCAIAWDAMITAALGKEGS